MLKLNKLFHKGGPDSDVFEDRVLPTIDRRKYLVACKNKVRDHLKPLIREATKSILGMDRVVEPRFRTQGSWSYDTCVEPAFNPPQEMDWDYGVYLPITVWEENGPPLAMAKAYFELVERLLQSLCKKEGWTMLPGKDTCIRVAVSSWAHIDIPLYAAPEEDFKKVTERISLESHEFGKTLDAADASFAEAVRKQQQWEELDHVVMATRNGEWKSSDPEAVAKWFRDRVEEHGSQLRRVCRYIKSWRDHHWEKGGPTSVSIMIAIVQGFEEQTGRDDLAIERAAKHLSKAFLGDLREGGIDCCAEDFNRLDADERRVAASRFDQLATAMQDARQLGAHQKEQAIFQLKQQFGLRMPTETSLIDPDNGMNAIRSTPAAQVAPPVIPSTKAG